MKKQKAKKPKIKRKLSSDVRTISGVPSSTEQKLADTDWKYVPIRRLVLFLEDLLHTATNWLVHEPKETEKRKKTE